MLVVLHWTSISGDADSNTSITFSGSDIITFATGGSTAATFNAAQALTLSGNLLPASQDGSALGTTSLQFSDLFLADGAVIGFGDDNEVTLTHVADTGLLLSSTDQLQFGDSGTYIHQSADGVLDLVSDTEIEINATTIDINGAVDMSSTLTVAGAVTANAGDVKVRSTSGSTIELTNTTTSLGDNAFVGGLAFRNDDTSGTEPHYAGIKARTDGAGGSQMELEFYADRDKYEADTPHLVLDVNGNLDILTDALC